MLFTIQSKNLSLCIILNYKNFKFKHLIDDLTIDLSQLRMKIESKPPHHPNCRVDIIMQ